MCYVQMWDVEDRQSDGPFGVLMAESRDVMGALCYPSSSGRSFNQVAIIANWILPGPTGCGKWESTAKVFRNCHAYVSRNPRRHWTASTITVPTTLLDMLWNAL